jgi:hypothetical protein
MSLGPCCTACRWSLVCLLLDLDDEDKLRTCDALHAGFDPARVIRLAQKLVDARRYGRVYGKAYMGKMWEAITVYSAAKKR